MTANPAYLPASRPLAVALALWSAAAVAAWDQRRPVSIDDEMKLRSIVDVRIAPDGEQVAIVVSTPNLSTNEHEAALFLVPAQGGAPRPLAAGLRIFNRPVPSPQLRWSPDGASVSLLASTGAKPQVFAIPLSGAAPRALTSAGEGVTGFEWSPDGKRLAYLTLDAMSAEEAQQRRDQSFVIHADAPTR